MRCINPYRRFWKDTLTGMDRWAECPCGKCIACLHNKQDEWSIRSMETSKSSKYMVYDTLTFSNEHVDWIDVSDAFYNGLSESMMRPKSISIIKKYYKSGLVPFVSRDCVRDWLKRGRENYALDHDGHRLSLKYIIFQEYGPRSSRPHFHLLMWGIKPSDYYKYFGKPWVNTFGWHKMSGFSRPRSLKQMKKQSQDLSCISRYISKYCSKGEFESPLVLDGIQPKPVRFISNGIGAEYLEREVFQRFLTDTRKAFREMGTSVYKQPYGGLPGLPFVERKVPYNFKKYFGDVDTLRIEVPISRSEAELFSKYVDDLGYSHKLPRYFKDKLLNLRSNNVLQFSVQMRIQDAAGQRRYQELQELAAACKRSLPDYFRPTDPLEVLCLGDDRLLGEFLFRAQKNKALAAVEGRKIKLRNHYSRPLQKGNFLAQ